jgi:hypothetical protein
MKPIPVRIPIKDQRNECASFSPRVTVAREMTSNQNGIPRTGAPTAITPPPRNANDARDAFARLFKK